MIPLIIVDCLLPIADLLIHDFQTPIGNWQLEIGNAPTAFQTP